MRLLYTKQEAVSTTLPITFTVEGVPRPKARARRGKGGQWYTPQSTRAYEEAVGWAARDAGIRNPYQGAVRLEIVLWLPDRRRRDVDNCAKSICDALNGIAYLDDSQIIELTVRRGVDRVRPRAVVRVEAAVLHDVDDMQRAGDCGHHLKRRRDRESRCDAPGRLTGRYHAAVTVGEAGD